MSFTYLLERRPTGAITEVENFVVNTGGPTTVDIVAGTDPDLHALGGANLILPDYGILIESIYLRMPYQFTLGYAPIGIQFTGHESVTGNAFHLTAFHNGQPFMLPIENVEIPLNLFVPAAIIGGGVTNPWALRAAIYFDAGVSIVPNVSMVNAPAALNGVTLPIIIGARVTCAATLTA